MIRNSDTLQRVLHRQGNRASRHLVGEIHHIQQGSAGFELQLPILDLCAGQCPTRGMRRVIGSTPTHRRQKPQRRRGLWGGFELIKPVLNHNEPRATSARHHFAANCADCIARH